MNTRQYYLWDQPRTLFPMDTSRILVDTFEEKLQEYIAERVFDDKTPERFLPQLRCYAAKRGFFLRRTVKLDPVAEYYLYDLVFRNRRSFRKDHRSERSSFGYRFAGGKPASPSAAFARFRLQAWMAGFTHRHSLETDVASYFNSIYHHDLVACIRTLDWSDVDTEGAGRFFRETNAGRSIDCLPQGVHPAKVLGSEFLRFVDDSHQLKSDQVHRFQDDLHFFDNDLSTLESDLLKLQELLGHRGLSLNDAKTRFDAHKEDGVEEQVSAIRRQLLQKRGEVVEADYGSEDDGEEESDPEALLDDDQTNYLLELIGSPDVAESDAELVLRLLREHGDDVFPHMLELFAKFPGLSKNIYWFVSHLEDAGDIGDKLSTFLADSPRATEFQIFWMTWLAQEFLADSPEFGRILISAYEHPNATVLTQAKVLEIPDARFGLNDLREEQLRTGRSDWVAWASALGTSCLPRANRNNMLRYFRNGSSINDLIGSCVEGMPDPT